MHNSVKKHAMYSVALGVAISLTSTIAYAGSKDWPNSGNGPDNTRNQSKEKDISADNVGSLVIKWQKDLDGEISANPAVVGKALYVTDWGGSVWKLKATDGSMIWKKSVATITGTAGDFSRNTPAVKGNSVFIGNQRGRTDVGGTAMVISLDTKTGNLNWATEVDEHPMSLVTASPTVDGNTVYVGVASGEEGAAANPFYNCCSFRGSVVALDANTGAIKWKTYTIPDIDDYAGNAVWGNAPVVDKKRQLVYVTTGNTYKVPDSVSACAAEIIPATPPAIWVDWEALEDSPALRACDPQYATNYFDSVLVLDMKIGDVEWAFRTLSYDSWTVGCISSGANCDGGPDFDFGQGPALFKVGAGGKGGPSEVLGVGQKSGVYWGINPDTGEKIYRTQVGPGGTAGGAQWGTAVDSVRAYVAISNSDSLPWEIQAGPLEGEVTLNGLWSALDGATGAILW